MVSKKVAVGVTLVAVTAAASGVLILSRRAIAIGPVAYIPLSASPLSGTAPLTVAFNGQALDANNAGVPNVTLYFFVNGANQPVSPQVVTGINGAFSFKAIFTQPGTYDVYVADTPSGI